MKRRFCDLTGTTSRKRTGASEEQWRRSAEPRPHALAPNPSNYFFATFSTSPITRSRLPPQILAICCILVTRLWYLREVDPRTIMYTGLTRDGTFLVENGKITKSLRNFRFNESPLFLLNNLEALGQTERLAGTEQGGDVVMPSIKARDFNFTSLSEAV